MHELPTPEFVEARASAAGLTIAEMCRRADIARSTFMRWKRGETSPTLKNCAALLRVCAEAGDAA